MKLKLFCTCGATATGTISPDAKAERLKQIWEQCHTGEGHAPCDAKTASRARRREEAKAAKELA